LRENNHSEKFRFKNSLESENTRCSTFSMKNDQIFKFFLLSIPKAKFSYFLIEFLKPTYPPFIITALDNYTKWASKFSTNPVHLSSFTTTERLLSLKNNWKRWKGSTMTIQPFLTQSLLQGGWLPNSSKKNNRLKSSCNQSIATKIMKSKKSCKCRKMGIFSKIKDLIAAFQLRIYLKKTFFTTLMILL